MGKKLAKRTFRKYWRHFVLVLTPLVLLPLPLIVSGQEALCGYMLLLMAVFWVTEALPLGVTGLIPLFLAPMLGLMSLNGIAPNYMKANTVSFFASIICALAIEKSGLHRRIALRILLGLGTRMRWLLLGFMLPAFLLSWFVVNTASVATMMPLLEAVLEQLDPDRNPANPDPDIQISPDRKDTGNSDLPERGVVHVGNDQMSVLDEESGEVKVAWRTSSELGTDPLGADPEDPAVSGVTHRYHAPSPDNTMASVTFQGSNKGPDDSNCHLKLYKPLTIASDGAREDEALKENLNGHKHAAPPIEERRREYRKFAKGLTLCCCYAANAGGIATLTGSTPNLIMKQSVDDYYAARGYPSPINYANWMVYGVPIALLAFILIWLWLQALYANCRGCRGDDSERSHSERTVRNVIRRQYNQLGPMKYKEAMVVFLFAGLILLWFFRSPGFMPGWAERFPKGFVGNAVPAVLVAVTMFVIPSEIPSRKVVEAPGPPDTIMDWQTVHRQMAWGLVLMVGGGYALANTMETSGLASWIADQLTVLGEWPEVPMMIVLCLAVALLTEVTSNPATCTLMMPIVSNMAEQMGKNPLYLMLPSCVCSSFAFMLPVAAPPNALAFAYGHVKVMDMVKAGSLTNVFCVLIVTLATLTWGRAFFDLDNIPWANDNVNATTVATLL